MSFASPWWLLALALVPVLLAAQRGVRRRRRRYAVRFPAAATAQLALAGAPAWRRRRPGALLLAAVATLAAALARPRVAVHTPVQEASTVLVSDHSGSMAATDVQPTRLSAAVHAADTFIDGLPGTVRVGAVAFGSSPDAVQAPVTDHRAARAILDNQAAIGATATGDALALALTLLHGAQRGHPPSAIVLLSDGAANTGEEVTAVARQAAQDRIPIYTVALGTPDGVLSSPDPLTPSIPVPPDPQLMAQIARLSGGRTFNAQRADELETIYRGLSSQLGTVTRQRDVTVAFAVGGLVLIGVAMAAAARWAGRLP